MGSQNVLRLLANIDTAGVPDPLNLFFRNGGTAATTGYMMCISATAPTAAVYAKGCLLLVTGAAADNQIAANEAAGYGTAPTWQVYAGAA